LPSTPEEDVAVAAYGLFIASLHALEKNERWAVRVALRAEDRNFVAAVEPGHVELRTVDARAPADLEGVLDVVLDSLAGRGPEPAEVFIGDRDTLEPFTRLRAAFRPLPAP
jgi:hypothetical protein